MASERERFARGQATLERQNAIKNAARETLGENTSLQRLSSGLLGAVLRTLEEAGMSKEIPAILRATADNYERAEQSEGSSN